MRGIVETLGRHTWLRIGLAVALILIGTAPIGAPLLSDTWRQAVAAPVEAQDPTNANAPDAETYEYRWNVAGGLTAIERSNDGERWETVASVPEPVVELYATPDDESVVYARSERALWISTDGGMNWEQATLPSKPLALAVASNQASAVYAGTESVGLVISRDKGATWQVVNDPALALGGAAPVAVTALTISPDDESIVYAAAGVWTGTSTTRLTNMGVFVSVDGGRSWLLMDEAPLSFVTTTKLTAIAGKPLAVKTQSANGEAGTVEMAYSDELAQRMSSTDPLVRASTAKILGLLGDPKAAPALLPALEDADLLAGDRAAEALGRLNVPEAGPVLAAALNSEEEMVRARAALALGLMGEESAVGRLGEMLRQDSAMVSRRTAEALARIGSPAAVAALSAPLEDAELTPARHAAMSGLEQAGDRAVEPLVAALGTNDPATRANAAEVLGYLKAEKAVAALTARLDDDSPEVRSEAAWALGEIGNEQAVTALQSASAGADEQTLAAIESAQAQAAYTSGEAVPSFGELLLERLAGIPLARWTWFALMLFLAAALLLLVPRETAAKRARVKR